jgi:chromosome segregation ATPase
MKYKRGAITMIRAHHFLTFEDVTLRPGPRLNMVLGPNGSGKSSIVCAMALALAGSTKVLGRSDKVANFVQHGRDEGWVEIELMGANKPWTVRRTIRRDNSSSYQIDGAAATMTDVQSRVKTLGIQVNNLCQFLPQDRVHEFSKMTPAQMLKETELALPGDLHRRHLELERLHKAKSDVGHQTRELEELIAELKRKNERIQRDKLRLEAIRRARAELELLLRYRAVLDFCIARARLQTLAERRAEAKSALKKAKSAHDPLRAASERAAEEEKVAERGFQDANAAFKASQKARRAMIGAPGREMACRLGKARDGIEGAQEDLAEVEKRHAKRLARLAELRDSLEDGRRRRAEMPSAEALAEAMAPLKAKLRELGERSTAVDDELDAPSRRERELQARRQALGRQLQELRDRKRIKLALLRRMGRQGQRTEATWRWVEQQKAEGRLKGRVLGPMMMEVECADPDAAVILERTMPFKVKLMFATETKEDFDLLQAHRRAHNRGLSVSLIRATQGAGRSRRKYGEALAADPELGVATADGLGLRGYLDEFVTPTRHPDFVMRALRSAMDLDAILVGDARCGQRMERLLEAMQARLPAQHRRRGGSLVCTPVARFSTRYSRYGAREATTTTDDWTGLRTSEIFRAASSADGGDALRSVEAEIRGCDEGVEAARAEARRIEERARALRAEAKTVKRRKDSLMDEMRAAQKLDRQIKQWAQRCADGAADAEEGAADRERERIRVKLLKLRSGCVQVLCAAATQLAESVGSDRSRWQHHIMHKQALHNARQFRAAAQREEERFEGLSRAHKAAKETYAKHAKRTRAVLKDAAERVGCGEDALKSRMENAGLPSDFRAEMRRINMKLGIPRTMADEAPHVERHAGDEAAARSAMEAAAQPLTQADYEAARAKVMDDAAAQQARASSEVRHRGVIEEYKRREAEIDAAEEKLARTEEGQVVQEVAFAKAFKAWHAEVRHMVGMVNATFSSNMRDMGFEGAVALDAGAADGAEDPDPSKFAVAIRVRFDTSAGGRDGAPLDLLRKEHQSGGEKSVTTIMYLLSLQNMTDCPFRLVDEINQGMDPANERKVFERLTASACGQQEQPQTFLITPKLLEGLVYPPGMRVHTVFNGRGVHLSHPRNGGAHDPDLFRLLEFARMRLKRSLAKGKRRGGGSVGGGDAAKRRRVSVG